MPSWILPVASTSVRVMAPSLKMRTPLPPELLGEIPGGDRHPGGPGSVIDIQVGQVVAGGESLLIETAPSAVIFTPLTVAVIDRVFAPAC